MTTLSGRQPAIALVDDDYHSARLMTRMIEAHGGPQVSRLPDPEKAVETLIDAAVTPTVAGQCMAVVDLKSSSTATRDFIARLKHRVPQLLVVAMAPSLDREVRNELLDAGASAVFERHSDIALYRREAANIVAFWVRNQRLDAVGT
jgi:CheY-like chemotaxis protein